MKYGSLVLLFIAGCLFANGQPVNKAAGKIEYYSYGTGNLSGDNKSKSHGIFVTMYFNKSRFIAFLKDSIDENTIIDSSLGLDSADKRALLEYARLNAEYRQRVLYRAGGVSFLLKQFIADDAYIIHDSTPPFKWTLLEDRQQVNGFPCRKAVTEAGGRRFTAWYCPDMPCPFGPFAFGGLPGLILEVTDDIGETNIKALTIGYPAGEAYVIEAPADGRRVSAAEYRRLLDNDPLLQKVKRKQ